MSKKSKIRVRHADIIQEATLTGTISDRVCVGESLMSSRGKLSSLMCNK